MTTETKQRANSNVTFAQLEEAKADLFMRMDELNEWFEKQVREKLNVIPDTELLLKELLLRMPKQASGSGGAKPACGRGTPVNFHFEGSYGDPALAIVTKSVDATDQKRVDLIVLPAVGGECQVMYEVLCRDAWNECENIHVRKRGCWSEIE